MAVLTKDNYLLDSILSYFRDSARKCVTLVPFEDYPYGKFNNLKSNPYNYSTFKANYSTKSTIEKVNSSKISNTDL
ncbi:hypothetical protein, partial [Caballeronia sp. ASUFL_F2_KS49]|uniref:hypothetical protein n=1 Tax=Caballeronia sp. ASUFL_F2_KS49 TaxID=2921773 RepID=UPI002028B624